MTEIDTIKKRLLRLYKTNPEIHIDVSFTRPKVSGNHIPARILGVYTNLFTIEEGSSGRMQTRSIKYSDIITGSISVAELEI